MEEDGEAKDDEKEEVCLIHPLSRYQQTGVLGNLGSIS